MELGLVWATSACWLVIQQYLDHVITVSEEEIANAMRVVWERMKLVIEPSAAVPVAVVLYKGEEVKRKFPHWNCVVWRKCRFEQVTELT